MGLSTKILKLKNHTLKIDDLWIKNSEKQPGAADTDIISKVSEVAGNMYPLVNINDYMFTHDDVVYMELSEKDVIPTIRLILSDDKGTFTNKFFPKDKALLKLYVKSGHKDIKPIRADFLITSISPSENKSKPMAAEGRGHTYAVSGTLNVPSIYNSEIQKYGGTSFDSLMELSAKVGLGFSSNEVQTNDKMVWFQPSISYTDMVEHITEHAYKDSDSFYTSFVDRFYNLTFINIRDMLSQEEDFDKMYVAAIRSKANYNKNSGEPEEGELVDNFLTNYSGFRGLSNYIISYTTNTKQGKVLKDIPNRKVLYYYDINLSDKNEEKFAEFFIEPFGSVITKEEIGKNVVNVWEGTINTNTHDNYIYAKHANAHNILDMKKMKMSITLEGANMNLLRGMRVPLMLIKEGAMQEMAEDTSVPQDKNPDKKDVEQDNKGKMTIDKDKSGYYVIDTLKYVYDPQDGNASFKTVVELYRASWGENIDLSEQIK